MVTGEATASCWSAWTLWACTASLPVRHFVCGRLRRGGPNRYDVATFAARVHALVPPRYLLV